MSYIELPRLALVHRTGLCTHILRPFAKPKPFRSHGAGLADCDNACVATCLVEMNSTKRPGLGLYRRRELPPDMGFTRTHGRML